MALPNRREGPSSRQAGRVATGLVVLAVAFLTAFAGFYLWQPILGWCDLMTTRAGA